MMNKIKIQLLFIYVVITMVFVSTLQAQGLRFYGNLEHIERRTSYLVFNEKSAPVFTKYIDISFELKVYNCDTFGYLFHIVDSQDDIVYSFTYTYLDNWSSAFKFNTEGKINHISMNFLKDSIRSKWIPVRLHIDLSTGQSTLAIAGKTKHSISKLKQSGTFKPMLTFGRWKNFVDLPSFAIRHLNVSGDKKSFHFLLNESSGEMVHDAKSKVQGQVINPYWLINDSYHWAKAFTINSGKTLGSNFNEVQQTILLFNQDSLYTYRVDQNQLERKDYANTMPVKMLLGTNFIDETANKIYAYEINSLPYGNTTIAALDVPTLTWQAIGKASTPVQLHHHNGFLDKRRGRYLVFGGFGSRLYSNNFLFYNSEFDRWDTLQFKGDSISPRFYSSMTPSRQGDYLYIYGGVGNETGDQSMGHNYYHDLYRIDLTQQTITKCWDNQLNEKLVPAQRMVLSADEKYLYVLRYAEYETASHLQLYRISVANGELEKLGDSIPFVSESIASTIALYYNPVLQEFYCIIQEYEDRTQSVKAIIYTLSAPPVGQSEMELYSTSSIVNVGSLFLILFVAGILGLIVFLLVFFYMRSNRRRGKMASNEEPVLVSTHSGPISIPTPTSESALKSVPEQLERKLAPQKEFNKIYLYGVFTVYGKSGRDITHLFSNKPKHVFLYILLNSTQEGVSSKQLNNIFWPEKTEKKVKNLKGVTISNLRKILLEIEGIKLVYERGFYKIVISEPCYCDYFFLQAHLTEYPQSLDGLLPIWERGQLLENSRQVFFDNYKQYSEDIIFSNLPQELSKHYQKNEFKYVLRICAVLLKRDQLYEPALAYSIYSYKRLNEFEKLYKTYAIFVSEYRNTMGQDYPKSLEDLIEEGK
ncbi:hypothetical protein ACT3CD_10595 [Geofilum sp. OHC36d9]|uniref:hypothetical protein n=1 Tax=Geofilum sp. OHC36d9 TaxID=3458413 RepID=UPI004033F7DF